MNENYQSLFSKKFSSYEIDVRGSSRHLRQICAYLQNHWIVLYVPWPPGTTNEHNVNKVLVSQTRQAMLFCLTVSTSEASQHCQVLRVTPMEPHFRLQNAKVLITVA
jgi:hypothetical protein